MADNQNGTDNYTNLCYENMGEMKLNAGGKPPVAEPRSTQNAEKYQMSHVPVGGARPDPAPIVLPVKCQHKRKNFWDQPVNIIIFVAVLVALGVAVAALIDTKIRLKQLESKFDGLNGEDGLPRSYGDQGEKGDKGERGANGIEGAQGSSGNKGETGDQGDKGERGIKGDRGLKGAPGSDGTNGTPGADGASGQKGQKGRSGSSGIKGQKGIKGDSSSGGGGGGGSYIRWGRHDCSSESSLVYQGFAAGTYTTSTGGGTNYQCMPFDPDYKNYYTRSGGNFAYISGVEYESGVCGLFPSDAVNQNVPCARCYTTRSAVMMIPAKTSCPSGWTEEYDGYLMTAYSGGTSYHRTTFECVDEIPQYLSGLSSNYEGAQFYFVRPDCQTYGTIGYCEGYGSYYENRQLTCVVCSK